MLNLRPACVLVLLSACAAPMRYAGMDEPRYSLSLHLGPSPLLDREDSLRGCDEWLPKGVICRTVKAGERADIEVSIDDSPCVPGKDGMYTLALAYHDGRIVFMEKCFKTHDGYDRKKFRAVMTHEIGHQVGIWKHVPPECSAEALRHPNGSQVCGSAVMNALMHEDITFVTVIDGLAFDLRSEDINALSPLNVARQRDWNGEVPTCVYRSK